MEKLALKIMKFLNMQSTPVAFSDIKSQFGENAGSALSYLGKEEYIQQGRIFKPHQTATGKKFYMTDGKYQITSKGRSFLEEKPGRDFDKWLNRLNIILPMIGGALLSKPLWDFIEWIWKWFISLF